MERWRVQQCVFAVETYFKNNDCLVATQHIFRYHFNLGRHRRVSDVHTIIRWVNSFRLTAVETYFKNNDCLVATQLIFRHHFNLGRHGRVSDVNTIIRWVNAFRLTASTCNRKPGWSKRMVQTQAMIENAHAAITRSLKSNGQPPTPLGEMSGAPRPKFARGDIQTLKVNGIQFSTI